MRITGQASVDEMIASFLLAEIDGARPNADAIRRALTRYEWPESLVRNADLTDAAANAQRAQLLDESRGWPDKWLFERFPADVEWHRAELDSGEVGDVLSVNDQTWLDLSHDSRRIADCATSARTGPLKSLPAGEARMNVAEAAVRGHWIARRYAAGDLLEPPILVAPTSGSPLIALEGHTRLVGWQLVERTDPLPIILGLSDHLGSWRWR
jgi:hypothetical protein